MERERKIKRAKEQEKAREDCIFSSTVNKRLFSKYNFPFFLFVLRLSAYEQLLEKQCAKLKYSEKTFKKSRVCKGYISISWWLRFVHFGLICFLEWNCSLLKLIFFFKEMRFLKKSFNKMRYWMKYDHLSYSSHRILSWGGEWGWGAHIIIIVGFRENIRKLSWNIQATESLLKNAGARMTRKIIYCLWFIFQAIKGCRYILL